MITALCIVALLVVILALVAVFVQMARCPFMWAYHMICGTPGALCEVIGYLFAAIVEGFTQS